MKKYTYKIINVINNNNGTTDWTVQDIETNKTYKLTNVYPANINDIIYSEYSMDDMYKNNKIAVSFKGYNKYEKENI